VATYFVAIVSKVATFVLTILLANINTIMNKKILKPEYADRLYKDEALLGKVAAITRRSSFSIKRWIKDSSELLTLEPVLDEIRKAYKVPKSEELTTVEETV